MFLVAALGLALPRLGPKGWLTVTGLVAVGTEVGQALGLRGSGLLGELTIGSTFDPLDLLAYVIGLALAAAVLRSRTHA